MYQPTFAGKRIVILGLARQGIALARFFLREGAWVTISDIAPVDQLSAPLTELAGLPVRLVLGGHPPELLDNCDLLCLSGGVPPQIPLVAAARRQGIPLSNDALLTVQRSPAPAIGITGSSGKTTTTTLVGLMLQRQNDEHRMMIAASGVQMAQAPSDSSFIVHPSSFQVWVGGNIGVPLVEQLAQVSAEDWLVLELSSFQLELFDGDSYGQATSPHVAAVLNVTPNHLDRHPSMAHYTAAKANVLRWQNAGQRAESGEREGKLQDVAVLGADDAVTGGWLRTQRVDIVAGPGQEALSFPLAGRLLGFGLEEPVGEGCWLVRDGRAGEPHRAGEPRPYLALHMDGREQMVLPASAVRLRGRHNLLNVAAACAISAAAGVEVPAMAAVASSFAGVEHRLELVRERNGVRWYNDSIATAPERAAAALHSFDEPIVLLAGGRDKKLPWADFARLVRQRVRVLILFGEAAGLIDEAMAATGFDTTRTPTQPTSTAASRHDLRVLRCADLPEAVAAAARTARPGDVVLLSPGGTSFDAYKDFAARGEHFRSLVNGL
ncbi:MAG TPA: Mur ligase family protein [Anaerolineae bacterium]|nr:Mur ligase family protein [Anaerolineae bacterium]